MYLLQLTVFHLLLPRKATLHDAYCELKENQNRFTTSILTTSDQHQNIRFQFSYYKSTIWKSKHTFNQLLSWPNHHHSLDQLS